MEHIKRDSVADFFQEIVEKRQQNIKKQYKFPSQPGSAPQVSYTYHETLKPLVPCQQEFQTNSIFHVSKERGTTRKRNRNLSHHKRAQYQLS